MAYPVVIEDVEKRARITLAGTVNRGDLLGYSSGWVQADADAASYIYAEWIALENGVSGTVIKACKGCTLYDEDAPYTADTPQYLSGTAGAITETRPTGDGDLIQVVGRSVDTKRVRIDIQAPKEFEMFLQPVYNTALGAGAEYVGAIDAGWGGPQIDAVGETCAVKGRLPSGLVGSVQEAVWVFNSINASAADLDSTIVGAYDGASNVQDTGTAVTAGDWAETDADNIIYTFDVSDNFDSGFWKPGRNFCVLLDPDGITGDITVLGLYIRGFKV